MKPLSYTCPKCNSSQYTMEEISTTGKFWSRAFDIQGKRFTAIICSRCKYTELYRIPMSKFQQVMDFFIGQ
jgi:predicted nucleic-acid-binding Zn-ribbon protein